MALRLDDKVIKLVKNTHAEMGRKGPRWMKTNGQKNESLLIFLKKITAKGTFLAHNTQNSHFEPFSLEKLYQVLWLCCCGGLFLVQNYLMH